MDFTGVLFLLDHIASICVLRRRGDTEGPFWSRARDSTILEKSHRTAGEKDDIWKTRSDTRSN